VAKNIDQYGGDPNRIYVTGHSAGGHLATLLLTDPIPLPAGLKGITSLSGLYDLEPVRLSFVNATLRLSQSDVELLSPIRYSPRWTTPRLLLTIGATEGAEWIRQMNDFAEVWRKSMPQLQTAIVPGADHFSMRAALDDPNSDIARMIWQSMGEGGPQTSET
jgi:arylformamidase